MKIAVIVNPSKKGSLETSKEIQCELSKYKDLDFFVTENTNFDNKIDLIFVVGGDGTLLQAVPKAITYDAPIICFNTGKVGFLAEVSTIAEISSSIERIVKGDYELEHRSLLNVTYKDKNYYALNDVLVSKDDSANVIKATVRADKIISSFYCDGILVSTPTGSTAYSLSAGGPILSPKVNALLLTPVCAHVLFSRPMVFSGDEQLTITATPEHQGYINIDGKRIATFNETDSVKVTTSQKTIKLIKLTDESFYAKLQKKLQQWTVENNN